MSVTSVSPASPEAGLSVSQPSAGRGPCLGGSNRERQRRALLVGKAELIDPERRCGNFQPLEVLGHGDGRTLRTGDHDECAGTHGAGRILGDRQLYVLFAGFARGFRGSDPTAVPGGLDRPVAVRGDIDRGFLARFQQAGSDDGEFARGDHQGVDFEFLGDSDRSPRTAALEYDIAFAVFARVVFVDRKEDARTAAVSLRVGRMYPLLDVGRPATHGSTRGRN